MKDQKFHLSFRIAFFIIGSIIGLILIVVLIVFYVKIPWNNFMMWHMDRVLTGLEIHPKESSRLGLQYQYFFGSRYTDVSECTFAVGEFRSSSLSPEEIRELYANASARPLGFLNNLETHIAVAGLDTFPLDHPADAWLDELFKSDLITSSTTTYYLVYFYEPAHSPFGDYRCYE